MNAVRPQVFLGIDPGFADVGYGVVAIVQGKEKCIAYGSIQTDKGVDLSERYRQMYAELSDIIAKFRPDKIALERLFFAKNAKTALTVAEARGVIRFCLAERNIAYTEYNPADVKIAVCGHGTASKDQVQRMVTRLLALDAIPKPDDAADALALAVALATSEKFARAVSASHDESRQEI